MKKNFTLENLNRTAEHVTNKNKYLLTIITRVFLAFKAMSSV